MTTQKATQMELRGYRTVNMRLDLWQKLAIMKSNYPQLGSFSAVIIAVLNQNKKLKSRVHELERELEGYKTK